MSHTNKIFNGKIALVTGGSRGIGSAICRNLAQHGAYVYINFHSSDTTARATLENIEQTGGHAALLKADIRDSNAVTAMFDQIREEQGSLHFLVNNAGVNKDALLGLMNENDWRDVMDTHLGGAFLCCRAALRLMMQERTGAIVNVSSVSARAGLAGQCAYAGAKAGLLALTHVLAKEISRYGIRVNAIAPGLVETEMTDQLPEEQRKKIIENIPLKRMGRADEIAAAVKFLLSDEASYVQGQTLVVDGGAIPW